MTSLSGMALVESSVLPKAMLLDHYLLSPKLHLILPFISMLKFTNLIVDYDRSPTLYASNHRCKLISIELSIG